MSLREISHYKIKPRGGLLAVLCLHLCSILPYLTLSFTVKVEQNF